MPVALLCIRLRDSVSTSCLAAQTEGIALKERPDTQELAHKVLNGYAKVATAVAPTPRLPKAVFAIMHI
jgi:hypothetical protein